jgi:hypothetical protein
LPALGHDEGFHFLQRGLVVDFDFALAVEGAELVDDQRLGRLARVEAELDRVLVGLQRAFEVSV